jgi:hypothetical protein
LIKVKNNVISSRNIFVINKQVVVVITIYDKSQKHRGKIKYIFRYFLDRLSQFIVQYLVYVLLFIYMVTKTKGDFLFTDEQEP